MEIKKIREEIFRVAEVSPKGKLSLDEIDLLVRAEDRVLCKYPEDVQARYLEYLMKKVVDKIYPDFWAGEDV